MPSNSMVFAWRKMIRVEVSAGDLVYIPQGIPHTFTNLSDQPARSINIFCPSGLADFLEEVSDQMNQQPGKVNMHEIAAKHELDLIGPPLAVMLEKKEHV